jgi:hypothetical protein
LFWENGAELEFYNFLIELSFAKDEKDQFKARYTLRVHVEAFNSSKKLLEPVHFELMKFLGVWFPHMEIPYETKTSGNEIASSTKEVDGTERYGQMSEHPLISQVNI